MTRFFGALLHFGFACPQIIIWKWVDIFVRCCTSFFASPQFVIWQWLDFSVRWCTSVSLCTDYHLKMSRFFGALLHFVFRFSTVCHLKMTGFFGALLHFCFASPQFVIWKWLDILVRCCTSVSLVHSLSFENDWFFWCVGVLRFRLTTVCFFKMTRFFDALLHFGFASPQFIIWKRLDFLVRCCTSVSLVHSLSFEND